MEMTFVSVAVPCNHCHETGTLPQVGTCWACNGTGKYQSASPTSVPADAPELAVAEADSSTRRAAEHLDGNKIVNKWGGARPGAGRKPLADNEPTIEGTITLPSSLDAKAKRIGAGNCSAGIRKALETFTE